MDGCNNQQVTTKVWHVYRCKAVVVGTHVSKNTRELLSTPVCLFILPRRVIIALFSLVAEKTPRVANHIGPRRMVDRSVSTTTTSGSRQSQPSIQVNA